MFKIIPTSPDYLLNAESLQNMLLKYGIKSSINTLYEIPLKKRLKYGIDNALIISEYEIKTNTYNLRRGLININITMNQLINYCS